MRYLYSALIHMLRPIAFALVLWRGLRNRSYWTGLRERFGSGYPASSLPTIWVHAVSIGEVTAAAPLIRALGTRHPQIPVIVTTATPTGRAHAQALFGASISTRYLPYDTPGSMRRFIGRIRPRVAIIMETELWPNLFHECRRRGVPVVLASARLSQQSVTMYQRFGGLFRSVFAGNTQVAAQSAEDAERFLAIGAAPNSTRVVGNVKFDLTLDTATLERGSALRRAHWDARPVWVAGSTHAGEEESALTAHARLVADRHDALLVLVPRHPERFAAVAELLARRGVQFERRSDFRGVRAGTAVRAESQVLLVDTMGELAALYASADVAFVGGSLVPVGGHNLLEPAGLGVPVITGPYQCNGRAIAELLLHAGGALQVTDATELAQALHELFADPGRRERIGNAAQCVVDSNRGSLARLLEIIEPLLCV